MPSRSKANLVHAVRVAAVAALLWLLPSPTEQLSSSPEGTPPALEAVQRVVTLATEIDERPSREGLWEVRDALGVPIASVARTLPVSEDVIGYRGPSEALIVLDKSLSVLGVAMMQSADTTEHVEAVAEDAAFMNQFRGWRWGDVQQQEIDGVSSATLTSLAFAKGVVKRMGGERPSLVFPKELEMEELERWFPQIADINDEGFYSLAMDADGNVLGRVLRTGPLSDNVMGYQGPTELLVWVDDSEVIQAIMLRGSFDNQPYVRYCKTEYGFWARFKEKSIAQLAEMDVEAEGIEGVSGATMTSLAVAETLVASAKAFQSFKVVPKEEKSRFDIRWTAADFACIALMLLGLVFRRAGWFRRVSLRRLWLVSVTLILGVWAGNLMSMALVAGWGAEGIAWRLAPGLTAVAAVAFLPPPLAKSNPYCNHLCPHGALQQLVRPGSKSRRHVRLPKTLAKALVWLPGTLLVAGYSAILVRPSMDLASWEPFHAYLFRVAPVGAFVLAGLSLLFAAFVPMGFCRMGCPTGRLIDYLRRSALSHRFRLADAVVGALLVVAMVSAWVRHS